LLSMGDMEYLIRFVHQHETFRKPEVDSLAELFNIKIRWISYSEHVGRFPPIHWAGRLAG
jgi:tRNA G10  N-methylase Trm11